MARNVKGFQLHITVDVDFDDIVNFIEENGGPETTVDELREKWNNGEMVSFLEDNFETEDIVKMCNKGAGGYPLDISSGYLG